MLRRPIFSRLGWFALIISIACLSLSYSIATAQTSQPADGAARAERVAEPLGLNDHMEHMQDSLRTLKRQIIDPRKNLDSANIVASMLIHAAQAKQMRPPKERELSSDKRHAFVMEYRKMMNGLCASLVQLEASLLNDDNIAARKHLEKVLDYRFKGHREYKQE